MRLTSEAGVAAGVAGPVTETRVPTTGGPVVPRAAWRAATRAAVLGDRLPPKRLVEAMVTEERRTGTDFEGIGSKRVTEKWCARRHKCCTLP